jgi:DNA-binding NarL/FixJ family response regulator
LGRPTGSVRREFRKCYRHEKQIRAWLAQGMSFTYIGGMLGMTRRTVRDYCKDFLRE